MRRRVVGPLLRVAEFSLGARRRPEGAPRDRAVIRTGRRSLDILMNTANILSMPEFGESVVSVRHALLALLSEGPKYGMQLRDEYEGATGDVWPLNVGQVYTTLQRLERDGLVESDDAGADERQKAFRITAQGETELVQWLRTPPGPARRRETSWSPRCSSPCGCLVWTSTT